MDFGNNQMRLKHSILAKYSVVLALSPLAVWFSQQAATAHQDNLRRYIDCNFGRNISIQESAERAQPFVRSVSTADGSKQVTVQHGFSLHIAYARTPFVNFKAERLASFGSAKATLIRSLKYLAEASSDMETKIPRQFSLNGFDVHAIDRATLSGGVQSVILLFRDADQTVVTLYILNTPPEAPQFSNIAQYRALRDEFVRTYTACAAKNLGSRPPGRAR
jgi:hypothetical protein